MRGACGPEREVRVERKRVIVTGGASGIGQAAAETLRVADLEVTVLDRRAPAGPSQGFVECDLADPRSIDAAVERLGDGWDALCNIAGIPGTAPAEQVIAVNFLGLRHLTEAMLPRLTAGGSIVNVASTAGALWQQNLPAVQGLVGTADFAAGLDWIRSRTDGYPAYNLSKEAVIVYSTALAGRARLGDVRANVVSPGPVETPILADFEDSMGKALLDMQRDMVGRHGRVSDIAPVIEFLVGDASRWMNGANLIVDGGAFAMLMSGGGL